ncbi:MAG: hypothetical protein ABIT58_09085 [Ferruginibacter sp.]
MKGFFLCLLITVPFNYLKAQQENSNSSNKENRKGVFYVTYEEFLKDSPSKQIDFTTQYIPAGKNDSMIVRANYYMADSLNNFYFWGFNDGENTFIQTSTIFKLKYWKAQCKGKNPYLYITGSTGRGSWVGASDVFFSDKNNPAYGLYFINKKGTLDHANRHSLKALLKDEPALLKELKLDKFATDSAYIKYITRYNEAKWGH